ncbi:MAG: hypothetical protein K6F80_06505 [Oscillospiraceae bacterium]|nr:hypothetical protein [Oscillospiraceae bacterium]
MKKAGIIMSLLMSVSMSLCLSFTGMMSAGQFTVPGFVRSFLVSLVISLLIGFLIPMPKLNMAAAKKFHLKPGSMDQRIVEALIADLLYSPIMAFIMITLAWFTAHSHGAQIPYLPMLLKGEGLGIFVGFLLGFMFVPLFKKIAFRNVTFPPEGGPTTDKP